MANVPSSDDLRLVLAVATTGSIGGAARALRITQPSASQRLSRIERRCGTRLFERDTTGARATSAGSELARLAGHILGHLETAYATTLAAAGDHALRIGTIASLAPSVLPSIELLLEQDVTPVVDHGPTLIDLVAESSLDAAVVAVADQVTLPRQVVDHPLGDDRLVQLRLRSSEPRARGRRPFAGRRVVYSTYDRMGPLVHDRLEALGARAQQGPTLPTTLAMVRWRGCLGVVPRSALAHHPTEDVVVEPLPFDVRVRVSLVTGRATPPGLAAVLPQLGRWLHLTTS